MSTEFITKFRGYYSFLSNFYNCDIEYEGIHYNSVECAYQASRFNDFETKLKISKMSPKEAKLYVKNFNTPEDWYNRNIVIMYRLLIIKFSNKELRRKLYDTKGKYIIEGNYWHDNFWGHCTCERCKDKKKDNILGFLLMDLRDSSLPEIFKD